MKFFPRVHVGPLAGFPAIRLQFQDDAFLREPESHVDVLISSATAQEVVDLLTQALQAQRTKPN